MHRDRQTRIPELDGWRAISIALVFGAHAVIFGFQRWFPQHSPFMRFWVHGGPLGVKIFFVISGFVICRLLLLEERQSGACSLKGFYLRRICRILPPLYTLLAVLAILQAAKCIEGNWRSLPESALFLTNFRWAGRNWFADHTWSLSVEEQFYLIFPPLFLLSRARSHWRAPLLIFLIAAFALWNLWQVIALGADPLHLALLSVDSRVGFGCIATGALMAIWEQPVRRLAAKVPLGIVLLTGAVLLAHPIRRDTAAEALYQSLWMPFAIALVLLWSLERGPWQRKFLLSRPVQAVGLTSYGIYLWQQLFLGRPAEYRGPGVAIPYLLPLLAVVVPLSWFLIEKPAVHLGKSLSKRVGPRVLVKR